MKKSMLALAAVAALTALPTVSYADDMFSFNVGAVSDYRYRGISQSRLDPAAQGGFDVNLPAGFYVGTWLSTIKWIKDAGGNADVEWDIYGGYKTEIAKDLTLDVGVLRYQYPSHDLGISPNTTELYGALSYGPVTVKYSHSVTNLFGFDDSKNSNYLDVTANFDLGSGFTLTPHIGYQRVAHNGDFSYTDASVGVSKEVLKGLSLTASVVATDTKKIAGDYAYRSPEGKNLGRAAAVVGVKYVYSF
jgi:uncharacterized protein (TIGR02001 family)